MSSPELGRRRFLRASVVALALPLAGCFRPLYGDAAIGGGKVQDALAQIAVDSLPDRIGHYLVQELGFALNGSGAEQKARYRLKMTLRESVQATIVNTATGTANAATISAVVEFVLIEMATEKEIMKGTAFSSASYERTTQRFAAVRAARDAEIRIAKALADQLRTRIAARFATGQ